tara:strand:+ start:3731 stop:4885 length:1155 start_codon:yes stop_codon:yes gene_type:complete
MKKISYGGQYLDSSDIKAVTKSLRKKIITSGNSINKFEKKISKFLNCKYATVCNSGTSAIFLSLKSIKLKKKDTILMPAINFISSYNVAKILGAKVILVDVDKFTGQITPEKIEECCKKNNLKKFKALIVMYNGGYPINADKYLNIKKKYNCFIIEDACHALGASYKKKDKFFKIGSCKHSDICTFSLHPLKSITTGEGGIITTNDKILDKAIKSLRSHGIIRNHQKHWDYNVLNHSLNFRLTDFQCELGLSQLKKINKFIKRRKEISNIYQKKLQKLQKFVTFKFSYPNYKSSYHLLLINIKNCNKKLKEKLIKFMLKKNIVLQYHYIPIYKFKILNSKKTLVNSELYYKSAVSLPIYFKLKNSEINYIVRNLHNFLRFYSRN